MPDEKPRITPGDEPVEEEYELLPHKEIEELKTELRRLKEFEFAPAKKMQVSLVELNQKLDRLLAVFDEAMHAVRTEEGGLTFQEKMKPLVEKMNKILDQNASIAEGMVAIADMGKELRDKIEGNEEEEAAPVAPPLVIPLPVPPPLFPRAPMPPPPRFPPLPPPPPRR